MQKSKKIPLVFMLNFALPHHCRFCGSVEHKKYNKAKAITCPPALSPAVMALPNPCAYVLCDTRTTHSTAACHCLHSRCYACGLRGHRRTQCDDFTRNQLRDLFEYFASFGRCTSKREERREWGFYLILPDDYYDKTVEFRTAFPGSYADLLAETHADATAMFKKYNALVRLHLGVIEPIYPRSVGPECGSFFKDTFVIP
jgi:hypothetical protein